MMAKLEGLTITFRDVKCQTKKEKEEVAFWSSFSWVNFEDKYGRKAVDVRTLIGE